MNGRPVLFTSIITIIIFALNGCNKPRGSKTSSENSNSENCMELEGQKSGAMLLLDGEKLERKQSSGCIDLAEKIYGGNVMALVILASQLYSTNSGSMVAIKLESFLGDQSTEELEERYSRSGASHNELKVSDKQLQSLHSIDPQVYAQKISPRYLLAILSKSGVKKANSRSAIGAKGILMLANKVFIGADQLSEKTATFEWTDDESILAHELIAELRVTLNQKPKIKKKIILDSRVVNPGRSLN